MEERAMARQTVDPLPLPRIVVKQGGPLSVARDTRSVHTISLIWSGPARNGRAVSRRSCPRQSSPSALPNRLPTLAAIQLKSLRRSRRELSRNFGDGGVGSGGGGLG